MEATALEDSIIGHGSAAPSLPSLQVPVDDDGPGDASSEPSLSPTAAASAAAAAAALEAEGARDATLPTASASAADERSEVDGANSAVGDDAEEEDDEYDEDDEEDDEDEEDEEEPKLKYQRLGASVSHILKRDAAKCLLASDKFLLLGTGSGRLFVLDLNGNEILQFHPHTQGINDLSLDASGDHVASCSNDGTVVITNLFTKEVSKHAYARGVKSVALPGAYGQSSMFALGGSEAKFMIHTKGWFSAKDHVIHAGEGPIHAIRWRGELLAWANDAGVKVYDVSTSERITHIARTDANATSPPPPAEQFRCHLCWSQPDTLLIGWADSVKIGVVKSRGAPTMARGGAQNGRLGPATQSANRYVQIVAMFTTEYMICGIAPWGAHHLVLMAFLEEEETGSQKRVARAPSTDDASLPAAAASANSTSSVRSPKGRGNSQRPELRIVTFTNEEVSADALPIVGYADYLAQDYRLDFNPSSSGVPPPPPVQTQQMRGPPNQRGPHAPAAAAQLSGPQTALTAANAPPGPATGCSTVEAATVAAAAHLEYLFYILAPQDIVVAKPRDYDDHISWLLARQKYEDALHYAKTYSAELKIHNAYDIGENFLKHLFDVERNYAKAAEYCVKLLGNSQSLWETYVYMFVKHDKLSYIATHIPTSNPTLSDTIYELVLNSYLAHTSTHARLLHLIKTWSHHLYHIKHIIENIKVRLASLEEAEKESLATPAGRAREKEREAEERRRREAEEGKKADEKLSAESKKRVTPGAKPGSLTPALYPPPPTLPPSSTLILLESLGELYLLNKQYALAFDVYLRLQRKEALFRILNTYAHLLLESKLADERLVPSLMRIGLVETLDLLVHQVERITVAQVMEQLKSAEKQHAASAGGSGGVQSTYRVFQYEYLHALFRKDHSIASKYHDEQVLLYAEFAPKELLYFLKNSNGYVLERALESCERHKLYREMVFLLKRMGNTPMALKLIIDELRDVREAIAFVEENSGRADQLAAGEDNSLWEELITRSLNNPAFLSDLLEHVGSHYVDLSKLIVRIPDELAIPKLRTKLMTILNDCELQQSVIRGCTNILQNDCRTLAGRLYRRRKRAIKVPTGTRCEFCEVEVVGTGASSSSSSGGGAVLVFFCRHVLHRTCYESQLRAGERRLAAQQQLCPKCNLHQAHGHQPAAPAAPHAHANHAHANKAAAGAHSSATSSVRSGAAAAAAPSLPPTRSILPPPTSTGGSGHQRTASSLAAPRTIALPQSSNVLPAATATAGSTINTGGLFSARGASPSSATGPGPMAPTVLSPPTPTSQLVSPTMQSQQQQQQQQQQIKPQAAFNRPPLRAAATK